MKTQTKQSDKQQSIPFAVRIGSFVGWVAAKTVNGVENAVTQTKIAGKSTVEAYRLTR